jgi:dihydroxy-acid dehydratase
VLYGYPLDGVVLTTGCDKTTPAGIMAAATVDIPAIVLSGGPMLDGYYKGERVGSGTVVWKARAELAAGEIGYEEFIAKVAASATSAGHCNTMGTATSMNALAEALGMSLPGCAAIPAPYRERGQMAYETGKRIVAMVEEDLRPSRILTREAFENAILAASALGASTNCPPHIIAIARHAGIELPLEDWDRLGHDVPLLVNLMPAGEYLGEGFHRAGGVPAVLRELLDAGKLHGGAPTATGRSMAENLRAARIADEAVIRPYGRPLAEKAGFLVLKGNLFDSALMKTSAIAPEFRRRYLERAGDPDAFEATAIVFDGPEDYHARINDPALPIDEEGLLVIRYCGPLGYPGSAEVVNMLPPDRLVQRGVTLLPCLGDGRQSGTSGSPSILHASPEAAAGGGLALLKTGDRVRIDLKRRRADMLVAEAELARRRKAFTPLKLVNQTPWQELFRAQVGQLDSGACLEFALRYQRIDETKGLPRHSH